MASSLGGVSSGSDLSRVPSSVGMDSVASSSSQSTSQRVQKAFEAAIPITTIVRRCPDCSMGPREADWDRALSQKNTIKRLVDSTTML